MRQCPTCQCFVPGAAHHCPRCSAALEPIEVREEVTAERESSDDRELQLVGAGRRTARPTGSGRGEPGAASVPGLPTLPPIDGPAGLARRPQLPKLPQPFASDPLVLAVFLGVPQREPARHAPEPALPAAPKARVKPEAPAPPAAPVKPESPAPPEAPAPPATTEAGAPLAADTFSALLGTRASKPAAPAPATNQRDRVQPLVRATVPAPVSSPSTTPPAPRVFTPVAATSVGSSRAARPRRRRLARHDPFARRTTRRERVLIRLCMLLAVSLALSVVVLRLPIGERPELGASGIGDAPPAAVTSPFEYGIRLQSRADLRATLSVIEPVYARRKTYIAATPAVMHRSLPQFAFVTGTRVSRRVGEISVAASVHRLVLAEYAGTDECVFVRVIDRQSAETTMGPTGAPCRASAAPAHEWTPLGTVD